FRSGWFASRPVSITATMTLFEPFSIFQAPSASTCEAAFAFAMPQFLKLEGLRAWRAALFSFGAAMVPKLRSARVTIVASWPRDWVERKPNSLWGKRRWKDGLGRDDFLSNFFKVNLYDSNSPCSFPRDHRGGEPADR